jgi:hypothetical protein
MPIAFAVVSVCHCSYCVLVVLTNLEALYCTVVLTERYSFDHMKSNEMGGACGTYGGQERCVQGLWWARPGKEITWKT